MEEYQESNKNNYKFLQNLSIPPRQLVSTLPPPKLSPEDLQKCQVLTSEKFDFSGKDLSSNVSVSTSVTKIECVNFSNTYIKCKTDEFTQVSSVGIENNNEHKFYETQIDDNMSNETHSDHNMLTEANSDDDVSKSELRELYLQRRMKKPKLKKGKIQLWVFLRRLLMSPTIYSDYICWVNEAQGIFRIEDSTKIAKLWGKQKNINNMNYDKLSRSIRQYYKKGVIKKTQHARKLEYQFCREYLMDLECSSIVDLPSEVKLA